MFAYSGNFPQLRLKSIGAWSEKFSDNGRSFVLLDSIGQFRFPTDRPTKCSNMNSTADSDLWLRSEPSILGSDREILISDRSTD